MFLTKQETVGKGHWVESRAEKGAPGGCPCSRLTAWSHGDVIMSRLSLASPDSGSFLR